MSSPFTMTTPEANQGGGGNYESAPAGAHPAVLIGLIDLGTQHTQKYQSNEFEDVHKILLVWELPDEKTAAGRSHTIAKDFRLSPHEKSSLRETLEKWRGKRFIPGEDMQLAKLIGVPCLLNVVSKKSSGGNEYSKVEGVTGLPKSMAKPVATIKPLVWSLADGAPPEADWIPFLYGKSVKTVIEGCLERTGRTPAPAAQAAPSMDPEEAPFSLAPLMPWVIGGISMIGLLA